MMKADQMWQEFLVFHPEINQEMDAWAFGAQPDQLADLVLKGIKTATASAYDLYEPDKEPLPKVGSYDVVLDSRDEAVCVIQIKKVSFSPFKEVSAQHAYKEGEGDKSLAWWREVHKQLFTKWFEDYDLSFTEDSLIVLEEFEVVYPSKGGEK